MAELVRKNPGELEFHQAVREVLESVAPYVMGYPYLLDAKVLERMVEPERVIMFRVPWVDDRGEVQINRGYRVQMNSAIGPYFQNMTAFNVGYINVDENIRPNDLLDFQQLDKQQIINQTTYLKHVRLSQPLDIYIDGFHNKALIQINH